MPKQAKQKPQNKDFKGFVNFTLPKDHKAALKAQPFDMAKADDILLKLTQEDYKITFSFDDYHNCHSCFLACKEPSMVNYGYILSGKGSTPMKALKQVAYIHYVIFQELWSEDQGQDEEIDD